ncbi:MAG: DNA recombination protein RmuC [Micromonosporaceae bacterium]|nr:DNA recombination protein RmuC [Micromonosporaceae bacterium]
MTTLLLVLLCLAVGGALGWFAAQSRAVGETARLSATLEATRAGEARLEQSLRALSHEAGREHSAVLNQLIAPLQQSLLRYEDRVAQLERDRVDAYAALRSQVGAMRDTSELLRAETRQLVSALRAPQVRGRWGEHQLRRIVEAAGMLEHCDFTEQVTARIEGRVVRPDLVVRLSGGKQVVVDAKAPFSAYLEAMEARDESTRTARLDSHARHLRAHVDQLSAKTYWAAFDTTPEFVVLFVPADPFLDAALQRDPSLLEHAFGRNIVLATPATLVALLRTVAYAWRQEALARNAAEVHVLGRELYSRLATMGGHISKLGSALGTAVTSYNKAVGSLESRVLVTARKFADLGIADASSADDLAAPGQVESAARQLQAPELQASEQEHLVALDDTARLVLDPRTDARLTSADARRSRLGDVADQDRRLG